VIGIDNLIIPLRRIKMGLPGITGGLGIILPAVKAAATEALKQNRETTVNPGDESPRETPQPAGTAAKKKDRLETFKPALDAYKVDPNKCGKNQFQSNDGRCVDWYTKVKPKKANYQPPVNGAQVRISQSSREKVAFVAVKVPATTVAKLSQLYLKKISGVF
jgi:hypothetical protein